MASSNVAYSPKKSSRNRNLVVGNIWLFLLGSGLSICLAFCDPFYVFFVVGLVVEPECFCGEAFGEDAYEGFGDGCLFLDDGEEFLG